MADHRDRRPLFRGKLWFWLPIAPLVALDLWSKSAVFAFLADRYGGSEMYWKHPVWSPDALVQFHLVAWRNTGTVWGLGQDFNKALIALRCVALGLIVFFAWRMPTRARLEQLVLGMILAGAIGNLYDNLTEREGGVRDFLLFSAVFGGEEWRFPAFNVADSCICVGAFTLAFLLWRRDVNRAEIAPASP
ncbi:MAG: signal peptidase II [Planctomycetota bacterium]